MATPNLGQFSSNDPNAQAAIQSAIQARSQGSQPVPQLGQTGQGTAQPVPAPQGAGIATPQAKQPVPEAELLIKSLSQSDGIVKKALADRLKAISPQPAPKVGPTV